MSRNLHRILQVLCLIVVSFVATVIAEQLFVLPPASALSIGIFAFLALLSLWLLWRPGEGKRRVPVREFIGFIALAVFIVTASVWVRSDPNLSQDWSAKYFAVYMAMVVSVLIGMYHLTSTPKRLSRFFLALTSLLLFYALLEVLAGIALPMLVARSAGTNVRILETDYINPGTNAPWREEIGWAAPLSATIHYRLMWRRFRSLTSRRSMRCWRSSCPTCKAKKSR